MIMGQRYWHVWTDNGSWAGIFASSTGDTPDRETYPYQEEITEPKRPERRVYYEDGWYLVRFYHDAKDPLLRELRDGKVYDVFGKKKSCWSDYQVIGEITKPKMYEPK